MVAIYQVYYEGYPVLSSTEPGIIYGLLEKLARLRGKEIKPMIIYTTQFDLDGPSRIRVADFLEFEYYDEEAYS